MRGIRLDSIEEARTVAMFDIKGRDKTEAIVVRKDEDNPVEHGLLYTSHSMSIIAAIVRKRASARVASASYEGTAKDKEGCEVPKHGMTSPSVVKFCVV